jgi:hypothetical protein
MELTGKSVNSKGKIMTTYTTTITAMYTLQQPDPNYVVNALWRVTGVSGVYTASIDGNTTFNTQQ